MDELFADSDEENEPSHRLPIDISDPLGDPLLPPVGINPVPMNTPLTSVSTDSSSISLGDHPFPPAPFRFNSPVTEEELLSCMKGRTPTKTASQNK